MIPAAIYPGTLAWFCLMVAPHVNTWFLMGLHARVAEMLCEERAVTVLP